MNKKFNTRVQECAEIFFNSRTEKNFSGIYRELTSIVRSSSSNILKNDEDLIQEVIDQVAMTIWKAEDIFDKDKSFLSWIYISSKNAAIRLYRKKRKRNEIMESDMIFDDSEGDSSIFENNLYQENNYNSQENNVKYYDSIEFHNCPEKQHEFILDMLKKCYSGEEYDILYKAIILKESPENIAKEFNINSRITVTSRNRRARNVLKKLLDQELQSSLIKEDKTISGKIVVNINEGRTRIECERLNGKLHGEFKEYYASGKIKTVGQFTDGKKTGVWNYYLENGKKEQNVNYDHRGAYVKFDRFETVKKIGFLN